MTLSADTQAILLLTAPLGERRAAAQSPLLTHGEYRRLARVLREAGRRPGDLLEQDARQWFLEGGTEFPGDRLQRLLDRGFALSQAIQRWQTRALWVVSRADPQYPGRLKRRLKENAPPVLYGCGDAEILNSGGLAVVGSRQAQASEIDSAEAVGQLAARAGRTLVSGAARGIDQAAMRGAAEAGGRVVGVLADSLERAALQRDQRDLLLAGQLALLSPVDPSAGFHVGHAMQRNKLIYALADAALVVCSANQTGGTWAGATEQLERLHFVPVYVRWTESPEPGLEALRERGALPWPDPQTPEELAELLESQTVASPPEVELSSQAEATSSPEPGDGDL
nr:DNA-processing protein DprA [Thermoanaerobaculia bacterium]